MKINQNNFDKTFDRWLDAPSDYKAKHNPFMEILGGMIKDWPQVPKINL